MIKGIPFDFGDRTLIVPPLSLGTLETMQERIEALSDATNRPSVATVIDCLTASLKRNYPEMRREAVAELVDVGNMADVMIALMDSSGIRRKALEAGASWGEALAPSNGAASTPV